MYLLAMVAALAAPANKDGKTMAVDDWYQMTVQNVSVEAAGPIYLKASSTGDLDGDGAPDDAVVRLACAAGKLSAAHIIVSPRDSATGQASGKRTHHPVTFVKEWGPATPQLREAVTTWDIKKNDKVRMAADPEGWTPIELGRPDAVCTAAEAARKATKSRSNIQNN